MAKDDATNQKDKGQLPTNLRLLLILEEVARAGAPVTPSSLCDSLDLPKPTVHRLLQTGEDEGFLQRDLDGRSFGPGRRMRRLSSNVLSSQRVRSERLRIMKSLAEDVGETCNLAAPGRDGMIYIDRVETHWPLRIQLPVGTQVPFHCTASGKMYLSSLRSDKLDRLLDNSALESRTAHTFSDASALRDEIAVIRAQNYSTDNEEFMEGMTAIAAAIRDDQGRLLTTLSLHAPTQRSTLNKLVTNLGRLREAVQQLEDILSD